MGAIIGYERSCCAGRGQTDMDGRVVYTPSTCIFLPDGAVGVYAAENGDPEKAKTVFDLAIPSLLQVMLSQNGAYEEYASFARALSTKCAPSPKMTCCSSVAAKLLEPRPPTPAALRAALVAEYQPRFKAHDIDIYLCQVVENVSGGPSCSTSWYTFVDRLSNKDYLPAEAIEMPPRRTGMELFAHLDHSNKVPAATHLTEECPASSQVLKVASQSGFKSEQIVKISGERGTEFNKIVSLSPLIVATPLVHNYAAGSTVKTMAETQLKMLRPQHLVPLDAWITVGTPVLMKSTGRFYYEVKIGKDLQTPQFGWVTNRFQEGPPDKYLDGVGDDAESWGVDGLRFKMWHGNAPDGRWLGWPRKWEEGDIIGLAIDIDAGVMQFSLNGDWVEERCHKFEAAGRQFYPAISARGQFTMLVPARAWQKSPPSKQYKAWANSGTYERPIVKAVDSSSQSNGYPKPVFSSPRAPPDTKELQLQKQGKTSKERVNLDGTWIMTGYDGDIDALLHQMGYNAYDKSYAAKARYGIGELKHIIQQKGKTIKIQSTSPGGHKVEQTLQVGVGPRQGNTLSGEPAEIETWWDKEGALAQSCRTNNGLKLITRRYLEDDKMVMEMSFENGASSRRFFSKQ